MDLSAITTPLLQGLGIILMSMLTVAGRKLIQRLNLDFSNEQKAEMEDVAWKSVSWGIGQTQEMIARKGWDHADPKFAAVAKAVSYAQARFPDAMSRAGIDIKNPTAATQQLSGIMERIFPEVVGHLAASPATPPASPLVSVVSENTVLVASPPADR